MVVIFLSAHDITLNPLYSHLPILSFKILRKLPPIFQTFTYQTTITVGKILVEKVDKYLVCWTSTYSSRTTSSSRSTFCLVAGDGYKNKRTHLFFYIKGQWIYLFYDSEFIYLKNNYNNYTKSVEIFHIHIHSSQSVFCTIENIMRRRCLNRIITACLSSPDSVNSPPR